MDKRSVVFWFLKWWMSRQDHPRPLKSKVSKILFKKVRVWRKASKFLLEEMQFVSWMILLPLSSESFPNKCNFFHVHEQPSRLGVNFLSPGRLFSLIQRHITCILFFVGYPMIKWCINVSSGTPENKSLQKAYYKNFFLLEQNTMETALYLKIDVMM